jgi:hypothetical protein
VLANPAARVRTVRAWTRRSPYQRVRAAKAGGYSTALIATPATAHAAMNQPNVGASATPTSATTPSAEPAVISHRGPCRSSQRPTPMPSTAETTRPSENAPVSRVSDQPVSELIPPASTGNA